MSTGGSVKAESFEMISKLIAAAVATDDNNVMESTKNFAQQTMLDMLTQEISETSLLDMRKHEVTELVSSIKKSIMDNYSKYKCRYVVKIEHSNYMNIVNDAIETLRGQDIFVDCLRSGTECVLDITWE